MSKPTTRTVYKEVPVLVRHDGEEWVAESLVNPYVVRPGKTRHIALANLTNVLNFQFRIENRPYKAKLVEVEK